MSKRERMRMESRVIGLPVELRETEGESPKIVGHASVYYRADEPGTEFELWPGVKERVMPGAYTRAIREDDVRGLFNHNEDNVLGRNKSGTMRLFEDDIGLGFEITPPDDEFSTRVVNLLRRGDVSGSSIAFIATDEEWVREDEQDIRKITGMRLFDVGPVTFPAFESTDSGVRSHCNIDDAKSSFEKWKESNARRISSYRTKMADLASRGIDLRNTGT